MLKKLASITFLAVLATACSVSLPGASPAGPEDSISAETTVTPPTTPINEIDFDALFRELDAQRVAALYDDAADKLAKVSLNKQSITNVERAAEVAGEWKPTDDYSYTTDSVEIFHVLNDSSVVLFVESTLTGHMVKQDVDGTEVDRSDARETPSEARLVWLERRNSDVWKFQRFYGLPTPEFPRTLDGFSELISEDVDGQTVTLWGANVANLACIVVVHPDSFTTPKCIGPFKEMVTTGADSKATLIHQLDIKENFEVLYGVSNDNGWVVNDGDDITKISTELGHYYVGLTASKPDKYQSGQLGNGQYKVGSDKLDLVVEREAIRRYNRGEAPPEEN